MLSRDEAQSQTWSVPRWAPQRLHWARQETWQQKGQMGQGEAVREKTRAGNMTPNFILTPINQSCSGASTRLCRPPPHAGSIWNRSEHRPERVPRHGDPVGLSGSKREAIFLFSPQKKGPIEMSRSSAGYWREPSAKSIVGKWQHFQKRATSCWHRIRSLLFSQLVPPDRMSSTHGRREMSDMLGQWHRSFGSGLSSVVTTSDLSRGMNNKCLPLTPRHEVSQTELMAELLSVGNGQV